MKSPLSRSMARIMYPLRSTIARFASVVATVGAALLCIAAPASAQGVCVVCSDPQAVYNCQPDQGTPLRASDPRFNLLCITELARAGNHASCSARRLQAGSCDGPVRTVAIGPMAPIAPVSAPQQEAQPADPARDAKAPPETVEQLAKETATKSKEQLVKATDKVGDVAKKTGEAVEDAAKKSWDCVTSLFKKC